jgi:hypothetical protein
LTSIYLSNQFIATPNGLVKPQTGAAAAAAVRDLFHQKILM